MDEVATIVERIEHDFAAQTEPFEDVTFPQERLLEAVKVHEGGGGEPVSLSMEERMGVVSLFSMFDYNRDANQLADNLIELYERQPDWFDAYGVLRPQEWISTVFEDIGFRYPNRDAKTLAHNAHIVRSTYNGRWTELLLSVQCSATGLVERLRSDDFRCLSGDKIAPMYARLAHENVCNLSDVWDLHIAVDTHIRRLSHDLFDDETLSDDEIRREWRALAIETDVSRAVIDGALWQIGSNWDEWGEGYWDKVAN